MVSKPFLILKVSMVLFVCVTMAYFTPKLKPSSIESAILKTICISSFVFFLLEMIVCIFIYGFVRGKDTYLRRDYFNMLNLLLLAL